MTRLSYRIIPFTTAHLGAITDIYAHHVKTGTASFEETPPTKEKMKARFAALAQQDYPLLVAQTQAGEIIGYAYAGPHKLRSAYRFTVEDSIYVAPSYLGCGIGKALLMALIEACNTGPFQQMIAVIGDSANVPSIRVHEACGFTPIGLSLIHI